MTAAAVSVQPLVDALAASLATRGVLVGDGRKPAGVTNRPYVVAWWDAGTVLNRSLRSRDGFTVVGTFHAVGLTPEAARIATRQLRASIIGLHRADVGGWLVQMPENLTAVPLQRDDDVDPPIFTQIDEWRFPLTPA